MSENSEHSEMAGGLSEEKEAPVNPSILTMMKEMQNNIASLASSVVELKRRGQKRKAENQPCSSKDLSDVSSDEEDEEKTQRDEFGDLVDEVDEVEEFDNDTILDELAECFGTEEKCGEPVHEKLAKVTSDGVRAVLNAEKIKEVSEKYNRPRNVLNLSPPKINEEIRAHLSRKTRNQDIKLQRTQTLVAKAIVPQLQQINLLLNAKQKGEGPSTKDLTTLAMDGLKLMTYVYCDLSQRRREFIIQPESNDEFRVLCSNDYPVTDKLFGDDLGKKVEDITKANKVGSKISGSSNRPEKRSFPSRKYQGQRPYNQTNRPQPFLGQRSFQGYKRKMYPNNKLTKK
ncbi:uncharacterized protein LOC128155790 [Crassostrea angulata]|uniref:uncharacterized protein LOC128155790 n=1 Tax=Magallana angulata TaxID=2784310 RepID=UPI0022B16BBA|nr:uncharacterized protein LOC128155790 [Crassostrea angulata]